MFAKFINKSSVALDDFYDFTFHVHGKAFKVHRIGFAGEFQKDKERDFFIILLTTSASSSVFANIFKAHAKEYKLEDVSVDVFDQIVKFVYTGIALITENNENELLAAAVKFDVKDLWKSINLHMNMRVNPIMAKEVETLKLDLDNAKYLYDKAIERNSIKDPACQLPSRYY